MKNIIIKNGIISGIFVSIVMRAVTLHLKTYPDRKPSAIISFGSMLLVFIFVIRGIKRELETNRVVITFRAAFLAGFCISLLISIIYDIIWLAINYNFFPNVIEKYAEMIFKKVNPDEVVA